MRGLLLFLFIAISLTNFSQSDCNYTVSGRVIDEHDGQPLTFANIFIIENGKGVVTDSSGNYSIGNLCPGTYTIRCTHIGCEDVLDTISLTGNLELNFYPEHHTELLENAVIESESKLPESSQQIEKLDAKALRSVRGENLGNSLKSVTGVSSLNTGNNISKPVIHGMHSNRVLIMNNGVRHEGQQWGNEHAPEIDPSIAGDINVVKGANSLRYGPDAIAGVILVDPRPLRSSNGMDAELSLTGMSNGRQGNASALIQGNHGNSEAIRWRLQGSLKRGGNLYTPDYYLKNTGVREYNYSAGLGYLKEQYGIELYYSQFNSDIGIFAASHIGNLTDLENAFEADEPLESAEFTYDIDRPWQQIKHDLMKARAYYRFNEGSVLELVYARQYNKRLEYDKDQSYDDSIRGLNLPALQFEITTNTTDLIYKNVSNRSWRFTAGINWLHQANQFEGRFFIPNFYKYGLGGYVIERWVPESSQWEFEVGLRYDYVLQEVFIRRGETVVEPVHEYHNISGNIGSIWKCNKNMNLRGNAGLAWRPPNVNELYSDGLHHGSASVEIGDSTLTEEKAYNVSISMDVAKKRWYVDVGVYFNYLDDYIYLRPVQPPTLTIRGAFPTFQYSQVDANIYGLDAALGYDVFRRLNFSVKASMVRAYNRSDDEYLVLIPADRFEYALKYSLKDVKRFKSSFIGVGLTHVLEQTRVPDNSDYVPPPPAYALLGIQAGTDLIVGKQKLHLILRVDNLLNERYRDYMNRLRYFADDMGRNVSLSLILPIEITNNK